MIKLIKNELFKIFHKKSTYITLFVFIAILVLITGLATNIDDETVINYEYSEENKNMLNLEIQRLDPNNEDEVRQYIALKSRIDNIDFINNYDVDSWQRQVITYELGGLTYDLNYATYISKDEEEIAEKEAALEEFKSRLEGDDWKSFVIETKKMCESELIIYKNQLASTTDTSVIEELKTNIEKKELEKEIADYRLSKNIQYGNDYLNSALSTYLDSKTILIDLDKENLSKDEKEIVRNAKESAAMSKYIIDNEADIEYTITARVILKTVILDSMILFMLFAALIAGGIVADEFNKGTIKNLLIKPYTRIKIILAKYITSVIMLLFCAIVIVVAQFFIGGIFDGFDSYKIPVVIYNYATETVIETSMITYILKTFLSILPLLLMILTLSFAISTIFTNTAVAVSIPLIGSFFSSTINGLIQKKKIGWLNYFPTMNWDLSCFLYGGKSTLVPFSLKKCLIIDIVYILGMLLITIYIFKKKNVKNI